MPSRYPVFRDKSADRYMLAGSGQGKKCSECSEKDIDRCEMAVARRNQKRYAKFGHNCHTQAAQSLSE